MTSQPMTLMEILSNEELRHHEFPVTREKVFLAHAGVCPLPRRVFEAVQKYARECMLADQEEVLPELEIRKTRQLAATLLGAQMEEIDRKSTRLNSSHMSISY